MNECDKYPAPAGGLSARAVAESRRRHGWNELPRARPASAVKILLRQFSGSLILILALAAVIALSLGERIDALAITLVLGLNAVLGFVQEWRAETALDALRAMLSPNAVVLRDGWEQVIPARELVPGDRVIVSTGETVPADMTIQLGAGIGADESVLTGESVPVEKQAGDAGEAGQLFAGTALTAGRAEGTVTAIGLATRFGKVAALTGAVGEKKTNLQQRLGHLARQLGLASVMVGAAVVALGLAVGRPAFEMFMTGLSLAVAMVPEGLPAVVTITLAIGATAMARKNALARRLQAVETLGAASVICTDKTGTLTENQMTATRIWTAGRSYAVTGSGYDPTGHIETNGQRVRAEGDGSLARLLETALICTHATLQCDGAGWTMIGTPTEGALVTLAYKGWAPLPDRETVISEKPFSSERKRMSVLAGDGAELRLHVKGAPEVVLERADFIQTDDGPVPLDDALRQRIGAAYAEMAGDGLRVLALAARPASADDYDERLLVFLGLVGMIDPPRPEVAQAIAGARRAGIRVIMITGDAALTAGAVASKIGLGRPEAIEGAALDDLSDEALRTRLRGDIFFARVRPEQKLRIVRALQSDGHIVAMTGDGVNDAPALKSADIGVAMGIRGTDVSRGAADLVLLDDNFATIVAAIAEGRRQFDNVKKFVRYLLSSNAGEVVAIAATLALGGPLIFLATQILWMNLITDSVTAVALGLERAESGQMKHPPRPQEAPILGREGMLLILCFGLYTGAASLWIFHALLPQGVDLARTAAFTGMVVFEKVSVFAFRSLSQPVSRIGWLSNPFLLAAFTASLGLQVCAIYWAPLQTMLKTVPLGASQWLQIAALALPLLVVPEFLKTVRMRLSQTGAKV